MEESITYYHFVQGEPKAQPRPRKGKDGNFYNPHTADVWKETIQISFLSRRKKTILGPVSISAAFFFYASPQKYKPSPHLIKPDIDNLIKPVMDALKGVGIYKDDCQVFKISTQKHWTNKREEEGVLLVVSEVV